MDLVERYLLNVRTFLPRPDKDDLVTDLGENIRAQVEDREAALGRPLTGEEQAAVLVLAFGAAASMTGLATVVEVVRGAWLEFRRGPA